MKKFLAFIFMVLGIGIVSATSIDMQKSLDLEQNEGIVDLPTITVVFDELVTSFSLNIKDGDFMIFNPNDNFNFSEDQKIVYFNGEFSGQLEITGLQIRTYYEDIRSARLWLDSDADGIFEAQTTRYIELDEDKEHDDEMKPLAISNLNYLLDDGTVVLSRTKSPDLDVMKQIIRVLRDDGGARDYFLTAGDDTYTLTDLDLENHSYTIQVYAKDIYYAGEIQEITIIDTTISTDPEITTDENDTQTGSTIDENDSPLPELYRPQSELTSLVDLAQRFDIFIQARLTMIDADLEKQILARTARNEAIQLLESFKLGTVSATDFSTQLKLVIAKLVSALE